MKHRLASKMSACCVLLLLGTGLAACGGDTTVEGGKSVVQLGIVSASMAQAPIYAAIDQGYFDDAGIEIKITDFSGGGTQPLSALASGDIEVLSTGVPPFVATIASGALTGKLFYQLYDAPFDVIANKKISSLDELKKGSVAISNNGSQDQIWFQYAVSKEGHNPADFTYAVGGGAPQRLAGVISGAFDGAAQATQIRSQYEGKTNILIDSEKSGNHLPAILLGAATSYLDKNGKTVAGFVGAIQKGTKYVREASNRAAVVKLCQTYTKSTEQVCEGSYDPYIEEPSGMTWSATGEVNEAGMKDVVEATASVLPNVKGVKAEDMYTNEFTKAGK
ncbi:ABC transporter substrate-binding protein [Streptosporangium sp. NPDC050280]|uniref:ABC transporter substrate-binding protein n=1 Tax=unclassified Streptosporangium TaxID=2632669 RepID=UPI00343D2BAD